MATYKKRTFTNCTDTKSFFDAIRSIITGTGEDDFNDGDKLSITLMGSRSSNKWTDPTNTSYVEQYINIRIKNPLLNYADSNVGISLLRYNNTYYNTQYRLYVCPCYYTGNNLIFPCTRDESHDLQKAAISYTSKASSTTPFLSDNAATEYTIVRYCLDQYSIQYEIKSSACSDTINFGFLIVKDMVGQSHVFVCGQNSWLNNINLTTIPGTDGSGYTIFVYHNVNEIAQRVTLQTVNPSLFPTSEDLVKFVFVPFGFSATTATRHFYNLRFDNDKRLYVLCQHDGPCSFAPDIVVSIDGTSYLSLKRIFKLVTDDSYEPADGLLAAESSVF